MWPRIGISAPVRLKVFDYLLLTLFLGTTGHLRRLGHLTEESIAKLLVFEVLLVIIFFTAALWRGRSVLVLVLMAEDKLLLAALFGAVVVLLKTVDLLLEGNVILLVDAIGRVNFVDHLCLLLVSRYIGLNNHFGL